MSRVAHAHARRMLMCKFATWTALILQYMFTNRKIIKNAAMPHTGACTPDTGCFCAKGPRRSPIPTRIQLPCLLPVTPPATKKANCQGAPRKLMAKMVASAQSRRRRINRCIPVLCISWFFSAFPPHSHTSRCCVSVPHLPVHAPARPPSGAVWRSMAAPGVDGTAPGLLLVGGFPSGPKPYEEVLTFLRKVRPGSLPREDTEQVAWGRGGERQGSVPRAGAKEGDARVLREGARDGGQRVLPKGGCRGRVPETGAKGCCQREGCRGKTPRAGCRRATEGPPFGSAAALSNGT
eukprot:362254-Chlamydomonas_euryale.AAC.2